MGLLWIFPPLLEEPSARALADLERHALFARADQLARARTGAGLLTYASSEPPRDWARARLRALAACLVEARARLAGAPAPLGSVGLGLGEIAAWAVAGLMRDEDALEVMLATCLALRDTTTGFTLTAREVPHDLPAPGVALSRLGERDVLAEGTAEGMAKYLSCLHAAGARVEACWQGPVFGAARAWASSAARLSVSQAATSGIGWLGPDSADWENILPAQLRAAPFDLVSLWRRATRLGCTRYEVIGETLALSLPAAPARPNAKLPSRAGYYIGEVRERSATAFVSERVLSLEAEPYLVTAARLNKTSVLPGSFELEIGIEAGKLLHPELVPVCIDNALFHSALKLFEGQPVTMRLKAASQPLGDGKHSVTLAITSDLVHKTGHVLKADRRHCDLTVVMGPRFDAAPAPIPFEEARAVADPDVPGVLYQSASPLWLGRYFEAVWDTRRAGQVVRSVYRNPADLSLRAFAEHWGAPCLMDAVLQNPLRRRGPYLAVGIPDSIRKVRFFSQMNECDIKQRHTSLVLSSIVDDELPYCERMQVSTPEGVVLLEIEHFALIPLGWIDRRDLSVHESVPVERHAKIARLAAGV